MHGSCPWPLLNPRSLKALPVVRLARGNRLISHPHHLVPCRDVVMVCHQFGWNRVTTSSSPRTPVNLQHYRRQDTLSGIHQVPAPQPPPFESRQRIVITIMAAVTPGGLHESPRPRIVHKFPRCPVLLSILTLTQSYVTVHMRHVRSQHMCPKAGVNSLVLIPIRHTKYGGGKSLVRVQGLPLTASITHSYQTLGLVGRIPRAPWL